MGHPARVTLSIPNGGTDSNALSSLFSKGNVRSVFGNAAMITLYAPAALTAAVTVQVSSKFGSAVWRTLQESGVDVAVPAGKAVDVFGAGIEDIRFHSAGAEGAQRDFDVVFLIEMD